MKDERETDQLFHQLLKSTDSSGPTAPHNFQVRKPIPRPKSTAQSKELKGTTVVPQKRKEVSFEQKYCIPNQNYPLIHLEALKRRQFTNAGAKERWIATRNLRHLSYEMQKWICAQLHHKIKLLGRDKSSFYHLVERREERHFQIDRIIKYLSHF